MSALSPLPPLIGRQQKRYLARVFGSPTSKLADVPGAYTRKRCEARIEYEEGLEAVAREETFRDYASPDGSLEGVPEDRREEVVMALHHRLGLREAEFRENMDDADHNNFLDPFAEHEKRDIDFIEESPNAGVARNLIPMDSLLPQERLSFIALRCGDVASEDLKDIPADKRAAAEELLVFHHNKLEQWRGWICNIHGASDGTVATIPKAARARAARHWHRAQSLFAVRCGFELELERIDRLETNSPDFG